jgi:hypothetical protein
VYIEVPPDLCMADLCMVLATALLTYVAVK